MPLPAVNDLRQLREHIYPSLSDEEFDARLSLVGRSARLVLSHEGGVKALEKDIAEAMARMPLTIFQRGLRPYDSSRQLSHRLVHHDVHRPCDDDAWNFDTYHLRFASDEVARRIIERVADDRGSALWRLVNTASAWRWMPTARGTVFEALVLGKLSRGEPMQWRQLGMDDERPVSFAHAEERRFNSLEEVDLADKALWVPQSSTFESIDALSYHGLFQITTARTHPVRAEGMAAAARLWYSQMGHGSAVRLIFVVPREMRHLYTAPQSMKPSGSRKVDHEQFVGWFVE